MILKSTFFVSSRVSRFLGFSFGMVDKERSISPRLASSPYYRSYPGVLEVVKTRRPGFPLRPKHPRLSSATGALLTGRTPRTVKWRIARRSPRKRSSPRTACVLFLDLFVADSTSCHCMLYTDIIHICASI